MIYTKKFFSSYEESTNKQWLITNGIGGFASSTICGCNTRKYHGLLIGPKIPPYNRFYYVSKLNEVVTINSNKYDISTNECEGYVSEGYKYQTRFTKDYYPIFEYKVDDVHITKSIIMIYGQNSTIVKYKVETGENPCTLELSSLINYRDFHSTNTNDLDYSQIRLDDKTVKILYDTDNYLFIHTNIDEYTKLNNTNFKNMKYKVEEQRGLDHIENHFIPGYFSIQIPNNTIKEFYICFSTQHIKELDIDKVNEIFEKEVIREQRLIEKAGLYDEAANKLVLASDQFIIKNNSDEYGVIAGYPWFEQWGRDTFISFEGLLLVTKRFDIAKNVLLSNIKHIKDGIVPNTFNGLTGEGLYNSVDAGLWLIEAVNKYIKYTNDYKFIIDNIYDYLKDIIFAYNDGTIYNIYVDKKDGLLSCGNEQLQLTWMDAKIGDYVVTPRNGKCVEINALWYNALKVMADIASKNIEDTTDRDTFNFLADKCKKSFEDKFWNESKKCLYDVIEPYSADIRPNQVLSVSLSYPILQGKNAKIMMNTVQEYLYTPFGLRTLDKFNKKYVGQYKGDVFLRDSAYHQGTVWVWPIAEYIIAFCRINKYTVADRKRWIKYIKVLKENIIDDCIGSINEIFDGDYPHKPNGAYAQAWSVAAILKLFSEVD